MGAQQPWVAAERAAVPPRGRRPRGRADRAGGDAAARGAADLRAGHVGLRLLKTTGSAFTRFARDDTTTLPERGDRPLYIHLDVHWRYGDPADALGAGHVDPLAVRALG